MREESSDGGSVEGEGKVQGVEKQRMKICCGPLIFSKILFYVTTCSPQSSSFELIFNNV
jgi:regulation of enolase protein 1 (concanavalin A-like superfamily)